MIRTLGTTFAALLGLAFGSFLNVCLSRWPLEESIVSPRSHCRDCFHTLSWWENIPLLSWLILRGRCRKCNAAIGWRYPLVELAVAALWAIQAWKLFLVFPDYDLPIYQTYDELLTAGAWMLFYWLIVALAVIDFEHFWLPDWVTLPGTVLGCLLAPAHAVLIAHSPMKDPNVTLRHSVTSAFLSNLLGIAIAPGLILLISGIYWLIRRQEGIGLGDAKLMALLAAWLGLPGALLAFFVGVVTGAVAALIFLLPAARSGPAEWTQRKLPLGTFLCIGGIVSALWGPTIVAVYRHWSGF
jgi:leader peptidase (prepilin peptidase)/N-methyltransferase